MLAAGSFWAFAGMGLRMAQDLGLHLVRLSSLCGSLSELTNHQECAGHRARQPRPVHSRRQPADLVGCSRARSHALTRNRSASHYQEQGNLGKDSISAERRTPFLTLLLSRRCRHRPTTTFGSSRALTHRFLPLFLPIVGSCSSSATCATSSTASRASGKCRARLKSRKPGSRLRGRKNRPTRLVRHHISRTT